MNTYQAFLAAKLFRISNPLKHFEPDFEKIRFAAEVHRANGKVVLFSGCFLIGADTVAMPFSIAFSGRDGQRLSSLAQFAFFDARPDARILAFLSVIDFLEETGELPLGSLRVHTARIIGKNPGRRKDLCDGYPKLCERSAKDLPYDTEQELKRAQLVAA
ncbi:hypothetical protein [Burkholderia sp. WSM2230]|uniref:hypothetical protein n=1 Tax=Burkholderia sp. WSM2230 TaxID=944435 RepID=UPI00041E5AFD|nr:hypothetical protein [Burkholderia sp. WSM2230]